MGRLRRIVLVGVTATAVVGALVAGIGYASAEAGDPGAPDPWGQNWRWWAPKQPGTFQRAWTTKLLPGQSIRVSTVPRCAGIFSYDLRTDATALPVATATFVPSRGADCGPALDTITGLSWCNRFELHVTGPADVRTGPCFNPDGPTRMEVVGAGEILWADVTMYQEMPDKRVTVSTTKFTPDPEHIDPWEGDNN